MDNMSEYKNALVIGAGISGINSAEFLLRHVQNVTVIEQNPKADAESIKSKLSPQINVITGNISDEQLESFDLVVPSPGVFPESDIFKKITAAKKEIWGEIELAYRFEKGSVIAITGTNGKTTTTTLTGEIIKAWNPETYVVGNIGIPYTGEVEKTSKNSVSVAEISSYQLETMFTFHPKISAILNITPDHLDRHHNMDEYARVKESICKNQTQNDFCVLNFDDDRLRDFGINRCPAKVIWYGRQKKPDEGFYYEDKIIYEVFGKDKRPLIDIKDVRLMGTHNYENIMAAFAMGKAYGVPENIIIDVIKNFRAVEHRIEYVNTINDVEYYNDSKGTNPDASIKAIEAMIRPTVLIAGGYDKEATFEKYVEAFSDKVKELVVLGTTAQKIKEEALRNGFTNIKEAKDLEDAVRICGEDANPGDCVLLSPACASWDMFPNYEERGRLFKEYVNASAK